MTTDRDSSSGKKGSPASRRAVDDQSLLDLADALTALGNHLALAIRSRSTEESNKEERLEQTLEKARVQHERAVWALRELRNLLQK